MTPEAPALLTEPQQRRLAAILGELLDAAASASALVRQDETLDARARREAQRRLLALAEAARASLAHFGLHPGSIPVNRRLQSLLLAQRIRLEDAMAAKLTGYGSVQPGLVEQLDPRIDALLTALDAVYDAVCHSDEEGPTR